MPRIQRVRQKKRKPDLVDKFSALFNQVSETNHSLVPFTQWRHRGSLDATVADGVCFCPTILYECPFEAIGVLFYRLSVLPVTEARGILRYAQYLTWVDR